MLFWLSFADRQRFLGAMVVEATSLEQAVRLSHRAHTNPGGDVVGMCVDDLDRDPADTRTLEEKAALDRLPRLTLFSRDDLTARGIFTEQVPCAEAS